MSHIGGSEEALYVVTETKRERGRIFCPSGDRADEEGSRGQAGLNGRRGKDAPQRVALHEMPQVRQFTVRNRIPGCEDRPLRELYGGLAGRRRARAALS